MFSCSSSIFTGDFVTAIISFFTVMINYILLYKIRKRVIKILKEKIANEEIATTASSCIGCLADEISWEIYYLLKDAQ